jgi:hypothetical protein
MARRDDRSNTTPSTPTDLSANENPLDRPSRAGGDSRGGLEGAKDELKGLASQAREQTARAAGEAKGQVNQLVARQKEQAADRLATLASALREAGQKLEEREPEGFGRYADRAAQQVERASEYLRRQDLNAVVRDVEGFARRHPDLFLGGALIAGVLVARFLKASSDSEPLENYPVSAYATTPYQRPYQRYGQGDFRERSGAATGTYGAPSTDDLAESAGGF